ncbi:MAG: alkaline phosphatase [Acidobacteriota bacterium]
MRPAYVLLLALALLVVLALAAPTGLELAGYRLQKLDEITDTTLDFSTDGSPPFEASAALAEPTAQAEPADGESSLDVEPTAEAATADAPRVRNIILLIGDGMGFSQLAAARYATVGPNGRLTLDRFPVTGWSFTHSAANLYTDSAAGATALATGHKTVPGAVSVDADGQSLETLAEKAAAAGKAIGLVTDSYFLDATPSAFIAHRASRRDTAGLLDDFSSADVHVLLGETREGIENDPAWPDAVRRFENRGSTIGRTLDELSAAGAEAPLLGLFPEGAVGDPEAAPTLVDLASLALERLQSDPDGFFLMVETEETDTYSHRNVFDRTIAGVVDLDRVARLMIDFARTDGDTLVLVTADHDTGGLALLDGADGEAISIRWASHGHTAEPVPVLAYGAGAEDFVGVLDNTEVGRTMQTLAGLGSAAP